MASEPPDLTPKLGDLAFTRPSDRGTEMEATFAGALSFMRRRYTRDLAGVDVAVWAIPLDLAVTNRPGTWRTSSIVERRQDQSDLGQHGNDRPRDVPLPPSLSASHPAGIAPAFQVMISALMGWFARRMIRPAAIISRIATA